MTERLTASERIIETVMTWPGVDVAPGTRGETSIRLGRREIGHLHGDRAAHFSFPKRIWAELMAEGRVGQHPVMHDGWAARAIQEEADVDDVLALLRMNYDRAVDRHGLPVEPLPNPG